MRSLDTFRRAGRSLRQAKIRTLLTSLAIGVGAFTIMLSLAAGEGARQYADSLISSNVDPDSLFIVKDESIVSGQAAQNGLREYDPDVGTAGRGGVSIVRLNQEDIKKLKSIEYIHDVRPIYQLSADYVTFGINKKKYSTPISVYNPDVISDSVAGEVLEKGEDLSPDSVVVPESFAKVLGVVPSQLVGTKVTIYVSRPADIPDQMEIQKIISTKGVGALAAFSSRTEEKFTFTIKAVVKPTTLSFSDTTAVQLQLNAANNVADYTTKDTTNYKKYFAATAKIQRPTTPDEAKSQLQKLGYYPQTAQDLQGFLFTIVNVLQGIVGGFGVIALLASVFGIINTQYISVLERTSQIGLMKALGMRGRDVSRLFRYEAAWIGLLGGVIGIVLAWTLGILANPWITKALDLGDGTSLLIFKWYQAVGLLAGLIIVAIAAGYFPSRKAAKLDPIAALRTE